MHITTYPQNIKAELVSFFEELANILSLADFKKSLSETDRWSRQK